jgi:hypothetical protein
MQKGETDCIVSNSGTVADCHPKRPSVPCSAVSV